jgi:glycosyltransferase involved in cell wall biosynthesis
MRIAHIITRMVLGGAQENTLLTAAAQQAAGHEVLLITGPTEGAEGELVSRAEELGVRMHLVPDMVREPDPARDVRALKTLIHLLREGRYTLVHTHMSKSGVLGRIAARLAGVPVIIHTPHGHVFHSYYSPAKTRLFWLLERTCALFTDRIIALTENEKREHVELRIAPEERFAVIHSGVDFDRYAGPPGPGAVSRADFGIPPEAPVIGCVARLVPIKGHTYLLAAMAQVLRQFPEARLLLVGDGPCAAELQAQARDLGIADRVIFAGLRRDVPDLLRLMDLFALASLNEGMGRVLVEAMICRLPVVATRVSGIPDVVESGITGLLVEPRAPEKMAEAITALLGNRAAARALGEAGFRKAVPGFGVEAMVARIEALYARVLQEKGIALAPEPEPPRVGLPR